MNGRGHRQRQTDPHRGDESVDGRARTGRVLGEDVRMYATGPAREDSKRMGWPASHPVASDTTSACLAGAMNDRQGKAQGGMT